jgi:hypothetical protein
MAAELSELLTRLESLHAAVGGDYRLEAVLGSGLGDQMAAYRGYLAAHDTVANSRP